MHFELPDLTQCICVNANPRTELHGEERHRAIDLTFEFTASNEVLDSIAPGLRQHFYCNRAAEASQASLPDVAIPLPDLRFPFLPAENVRWNQPKSRGYRWIWDWGREEQHVDLTDVGLGSLVLTMQQGGSVTLRFSVSYNGDELADNTLYGELCGLAAMGELHIQLFAPAELVPVKKGWRSGRADVPVATDGGAPLLEGEHPDEGAEEHDGHPEGSPEAAFAATTEADAAQAPKRRGRRASLAVV